MNMLRDSWKILGTLTLKIENLTNEVGGDLVIHMHGFVFVLFL